MYQTNEPIFYYIYWNTSIRNILLIKIGGQIGALSTIALIFLTAFIGIYFAKLQGIQTLKSGVVNLYQNKMPIYEMMSELLLLYALLLIMPGFLTDFIGFLFLIPFTRRMLFNLALKNSQDQKRVIKIKLLMVR